jgi:WD40 repeat protein
MEQQLYTALLEQARATVLSGELGQRVRALDAVRRAGAISNSAALRGVAMAALSLPDLRFERECPIPSDLTLAQLDPSFKRIAICRTSGPVEIRSLADRQLLTTLPGSTNRPAYLAEWSLDGRFLAVKREYDSSGLRSDKEVWSVADARRLFLLRDALYDAMSFHPRLPRLLIGQTNGVVVLDLDKCAEINRIPLKGTPQWLRFAPDGESFAASYRVEDDWIVSAHRMTGESMSSHIFDKEVSLFNWHPSGKWIAVVDNGGNVHRMDAQTGQTRTLGQHKAVAVCAVFSPDGKYLFTGGWDRELICWDAKTLRRAFTVGLDSYLIQFRADGRQCAILRWPEVRLQLHAFELPALCREFAGDMGGGRNHAAFSPDGHWLAACGAEHLLVWDSSGDQAGAEIGVSGHTYVNFAPNGELFADRFGDCSRWRLGAGTNGAATTLERLALFQPAGFESLLPTSAGVVFTTTRGSKLVGYDQLTTEQSGWKPAVNGPIGVSPDGRWFAVFRAFTPHLYVHRLPGFERMAKLTNQAAIFHFQFSPLADEVAVSSRGGVEFWSTTTWQRTRHLTNFTSILYSPDARTFWLSTEFRSAGLYDARTTELQLPLPPGTLPLAISPDGRHLAVSVDARHVQVWDLAEVRERLRELGLDWSERSSQ